jgi:excinuclease ABC subunit A
MKIIIRCKDNEIFENILAALENILVTLEIISKTRNMENKETNAKLEPRGAKLDMRYAICDGRGAKFDMRSSICDLRYARCEVRGANIESRNSNLESRESQVASRESEEECIHVKGAKLHNLKNIEIKIPRDRLIVVSGLSGSGKSTLVFDTIFAEGQRRYVESLSAYARQFLGRANKPEVDFIRGIPPAIAIEQKVNTRNPRSTVGTTTEIYDHLKLLFARVGRTISPVSGEVVRKDSVTDVVDFIASLPRGTRLYVLSPLVLGENVTLVEKLALLQDAGFTRLEMDGEELRIEKILPEIDRYRKKKFSVMIDRITASAEAESLSRMADSVQTAFAEGAGVCMVKSPDGAVSRRFSVHFERDGMRFEEPSEYLFSFNSPFGACPCCQGHGQVMGIDEELVIPDQSLSIYNDTIACWRGPTMKHFKEQLIRAHERVKIPLHKPYRDLSKAQKGLLWEGNDEFIGLKPFFRRLEEGKQRMQYRILLGRYTGKTVCPDCGGTRLRREAHYVQVGGKTICELAEMPVSALTAFMAGIELTNYEAAVAERVLLEIRNRLGFLMDVGLSYLSLNRLSNTLSGGESQRINLATALGSCLMGSLYILDEPSIGLHPRDTQLLVAVLKRLRDQGNTVLVVEHDEDMIRAADLMIDIGPLAGRHGGEVVYAGEPNSTQGAGLTMAYLNGVEKIAVPGRRRRLRNYIEVSGARENNLRNINVRFPLNGLVAVTGVSGSGKSSLVKGLLFPALNKLIYQYGDRPKGFDGLLGEVRQLKHVEMIDQNAIGKSTRSNPVTYIRAYDDIRKLYAEQPYAKMNGYDHSYFSFNLDGGRCEECLGDGVIKVEMQFMADVILECETCRGKRYKREILEVLYHDHSIADVLDLTVDQALEFFGGQKEVLAKRIATKIQPLQDVGLGYIKLGQSSSTLSGGESQRVKLASFLGRDMRSEPVLFIFDEPTTGLHFHDIKRLVQVFEALISNGHSIVVVEHNMEIIKCADWVIDLGPEGGAEGGQLVFAGTPEDLARCAESHTGRALRGRL